MEDNNIKFNSDFEQVSSENVHHEKEHSGEHHHHHHHSSGSSGKRHHHNDSQQKVVRQRLREVRREKFYMPIFRVLFIVGLIVIIIMLIWALFSPSPELGEVSRKETSVTENVRSDIKVSELQAELDALRKRLDEYEKEIASLEEKLAASTAESSGD